MLHQFPLLGPSAVRSSEGGLEGLRVTWISATQVRIETGWCSDDANASIMTVTAPITLDITVPGLNGLDVGAVGNNQWYWVWLIQNRTTGQVGGVLSLSEAAPVLPAGFTARRVVYAVPTDNIAQIDPCYCLGNGRRKDFYWQTPEIWLGPGGTNIPWGGVATTHGAPNSDYVIDFDLTLSLSAASNIAVPGTYALEVGIINNVAFGSCNVETQVVGQTVENDMFVRMPRVGAAQFFFYRALVPVASTVTWIVLCNRFGLEL